MFMKNHTKINTYVGQWLFKLYIIFLLEFVCKRDYKET